MSKMTIGDCRVLANNVMQRIVEKCVVSTKGSEDEDSTDVSDHKLTGIIAEAVNEYFGVSR